MRVLGIDPGTRVCGYACVELQQRERAGLEARPALQVRNAVHRSGSGKPRLIGAGVFDLGGSRKPLEQRLAELATAIEACVDRFEPECVALEEAFFGKSVQSALRLGEARGVVLLVAGRRELRVHQYAPATVKLRVAGHGAASKEALTRMVEQALGVSFEDLPRDVGDATAIALCHTSALQACYGL
ncbi:MAG TPA: crossover junction endodeoxyribonuclease RuvC [Planctomycetota bacterium]|nr:crossover junction endodeoxyribonuclease RuvC [Planctomycetota bacterium]